MAEPRRAFLYAVIAVLSLRCFPLPFIPSSLAPHTHTVGFLFVAGSCVGLAYDRIQDLTPKANDGPKVVTPVSSGLPIITPECAQQLNSGSWGAPEGQTPAKVCRVAYAWNFHACSFVDLALPSLLRSQYLTSCKSAWLTPLPLFGSGPSRPRKPADSASRRQKTWRPLCGDGARSALVCSLWKVYACDPRSFGSGISSLYVPCAERDVIMPYESGHPLCLGL